MEIKHNRSQPTFTNDKPTLVCRYGVLGLVLEVGVTEAASPHATTTWATPATRTTRREGASSSTATTTAPRGSSSATAHAEVSTTTAATTHVVLQKKVNYVVLLLSTLLNEANCIQVVQSTIRKGQNQD